MQNKTIAALYVFPMIDWKTKEYLRNLRGLITTEIETFLKIET